VFKIKKRAYNFKDLTGEKFSRLAVIEFYGLNKHQRTLWQCRCDCGRVTVVSGSNLTKGATKSCGCLRSELLSNRLTKHGMATNGDRHSLYKRWASMKARCTNPNEYAFKNYGARGISVCDEWLHFEPFAKWSLKNGYENHLELDRIDNNEGYYPGNCRWVTAQKNQLNKRNNNRITIKNVTKTLSEWSRESGISIQTIKSRMRYGWSCDDLLKPIGTSYKSRERDSTGRFIS